jgi:hypothetical protein
MTTQKRLRFEGRKVTNAEALSGLGDPRTWDREAAVYAMKIQQTYASMPSGLTKEVPRTRQPRSKSRGTEAKVSVPAHMISAFLPSVPSSARYALKSSDSSKPGVGPTRRQKRTAKSSSAARKGSNKTRKRKK